MCLPGGATVVGVVKDYHFKSLHEAIAPVVMYLQPGFETHILVVDIVWIDHVFSSSGFAI